MLLEGSFLARLREAGRPVQWKCTEEQTKFRIRPGPRSSEYYKNNGENLFCSQTGMLEKNNMTWHAHGENKPGQHGVESREAGHCCENQRERKSSTADRVGRGDGYSQIL